ncbi:rab GTPase activator [Ramicandelaber brevisporus]|nr:rab GTPase activator [Ramicandelaber brevisporus]
MDRNDYYGGECASLNLEQLFTKFRSGMAPPASFGRSRDYAIDMVPKFMMANEPLVQVLVQTDVTRYLEFKLVKGSYVLRDDRVAKVPANEKEALTSPLMGLFEKRRMRNFLEFIQKWDDKDASTHQGINLDIFPMREVYAKFGLEPGTQDLIGHSLALYSNDDYKERPARETYTRIKLYVNSIARYGGSPYIYPLYGLGELPQGFARLSAIYGGTYMLRKPIEKVLTDESSGKFVGVVSEGETAKAPMVIGDPSYFPERVVKTGRVVRAICLLDHPIPSTNNDEAVQIILPQNQIKRANDIYIAAVSSAHNVCAKDKFVAIVSTIAETDKPEAEIEPALKLLGPILDKYVSVTDIFEPKEPGFKDNVFISKSYDATSHCVSIYEDVISLYERITGKKLELKDLKLAHIQE